MLHRAFPRRSALVGALCAAVAVAGFATTNAGATVRAANPLGTKDKATGTPVKIGFVTDDKNAKTDNSNETPVTNATVKWLNDYMGGVGGHPITLDRCVDLAEPGRGVDCANQMIADNVAAVVMGSNAVLENIWTPLRAAGIPVFLYGASNPTVISDSASTFVMINGPALLKFPAGVAKQLKPQPKKLSVVSIDVPAATSYYKNQGPGEFKALGLDMELIPVAAGTADMTPQMQRLVSGNPNGIVYVIGNDAFCIAAFNGLRAAGFEGTVTAAQQCISDATRTAVPGDFLKGIRIGTNAPVDDPKDPSMKQYYAVLNYGGVSDEVDKSNIGGVAMFNALSGFGIATHGLNGDVTPQSIITATKAMPWSVLPGSGGTHIRCNGKADTNQPAVCTNALLAATLDAQGHAVKYVPVQDDKIPD